MTRAKSWLAALFITAALTGAAAASGYSELNAGIAAANHANPEAALSHLAAALASPDLNPAFVPLAHAVRGKIFLQQRAFDAAVKEFDAALAGHPDWYDVLLVRGVTQVALGNAEAANADLSRAAAVEPDRASGYQGRMVLNVAVKQYDLAVKDCTTVLTLDPDSVVAHMLCGMVYLARGDRSAALDAFDKAIDLDPNNASAYSQRATIYSQTGNLSGAIADYKHSLEIEPADNAARFALGVAEWETGAYGDAAVDLDTLVAHTPKHPYALMWRALARLSAHRDGDDDGMASGAPAIDTAHWPAPVIAYYLGGKTVDQTLAAAAPGNPEGVKERTCEANFYVGAWQMLHGNPATGKSLLADAAANCPDADIERDAAAAALKRSN